MIGWRKNAPCQRIGLIATVIQLLVAALPPHSVDLIVGQTSRSLRSLGGCENDGDTEPSTFIDLYIHDASCWLLDNFRSGAFPNNSAGVVSLPTIDGQGLGGNIDPNTRRIFGECCCVFDYGGNEENRGWAGNFPFLSSVIGWCLCGFGIAAFIVMAANAYYDSPQGPFSIIFLDGPLGAGVGTVVGFVMWLSRIRIGGVAGTQ